MRLPITTSNDLAASAVRGEQADNRASSRNRRSFTFWVSAWLPVVIAIAVIATESTKYLGADRTSGPLRAVYEFLFGSVTNAVWLDIHHYVRKAGHFIGYGLVGLSWWRAWWLTLPRSRFLPDAFLALLATAVTSSADEFHQTLLPNRTGLASDVVLDCVGAIAFLLLVYLFMRLFKPRQLARDP